MGNHHPHVIGGIERVHGAVVVWSLGNLVFDQRIWQTLPTYLLNVAETSNGVERVTADHVLLDGFVPHGVVGKPDRTVTWCTLAASTDPATATRSGVALGAGTRPTRTATERFREPGAVYEREPG